MFRASSALEHEGICHLPRTQPGSVPYCRIFTKGISALNNVDVSEVGHRAEEMRQFRGLISAGGRTRNSQALFLLWR